MVKDVLQVFLFPHCLSSMVADLVYNNNERLLYVGVDFGKDQGHAISYDAPVAYSEVERVARHLKRNWAKPLS